ncbi:MAG: D-glycerate dehydrogenase [Candidatus Muiribacterium halophilum]|uniref:D-glycerate dehydrogenase n=1 Tax=Muiribacterium halophilum TaxID=2053465 RepID=A0A2N5ZG24_MUIH1|nr:MAG: D-glycerate dehydrogenase [Candidatus Muirbacterium halophilum]
MKVFITRRIPDIAFDMLGKEGVEVIFNNEDRVLSSDEIIEGAKGCDALITLLSDTIDKKIIDTFEKVRIISNYAVGYNNIDIEHCRKKNIIVCNTPDVLTHATAYLGFSLLLAVARKIPESDSFVREGLFKGWAPRLLRGHDVYSKTLGVIGAGRIGGEVLRRGIGFNMKLLYNTRSKKEQLEKELGACFASKEEIAKRSDFIVLCTPLNDDTFHMIDKSFILNMKKDAILINIARGQVVDEKVLIEALEDKKIAGAGLDVYENEPQVPERLKRLKNVVLLPHTGSSTFKARDDMAVLCVNSILDILKRGKMPQNRIC